MSSTTRRRVIATVAVTVTIVTVITIITTIVLTTSGRLGEGEWPDAQF